MRTALICGILALLLANDASAQARRTQLRFPIPSNNVSQTTPQQAPASPRVQQVYSTARTAAKTIAVMAGANTALRVGQRVMMRTGNETVAMFVEGYKVDPYTGAVYLLLSPTPVH